MARITGSPNDLTVGQGAEGALLASQLQPIPITMSAGQAAQVLIEQIVEQAIAAACPVQNGSQTGAVVCAVKQSRGGGLFGEQYSDQITIRPVANQEVGRSLAFEADPANDPNTVVQFDAEGFPRFWESRRPTFTMAQLIDTITAYVSPAGDRYCAEVNQLTGEVVIAKVIPSTFATARDAIDAVTDVQSFSEGESILDIVEAVAAPSTPNARVFEGRS